VNIYQIIRAALSVYYRYRGPGYPTLFSKKPDYGSFVLSSTAAVFMRRLILVLYYFAKFFCASSGQYLPS